MLARRCPIRTLKFVSQVLSVLYECYDCELEEGTIYRDEHRGEDLVACECEGLFAEFCDIADCRCGMMAWTRFAVTERPLRQNILGLDDCSIHLLCSV